MSKTWKKIIGICIAFALVAVCTACASTGPQSATGDAAGYTHETTLASEHSIAPRPGVPPETFAAEENTANAAAQPIGPRSVVDPDNSRGLPTKKIEHSFGVPQNGVVNGISKESQEFFDQKGYAAVTYDNKSTAKVLYLTFDCGYENGNTAIILDVLKEKKVPAAFFCTVDEMRDAPDIVARMIDEGHIVGNHSLSHPHFSAISRTEMAKEVLEADNYLRQNFGYSAPFFRFPYGEYNESALEAVASLGFTSVFWSSSYKDWDVNDQKGEQYAYDMVTSRLHPGAVILLHSVSSDNAQAMGRIIDKARAEGYTFRHLTTLPALRS